MLSIEISDTGIGIPADKIDAVFDEFRQLRPGSSEGAGLGLAIVRRTAELLGHPMMVRSTVGQGSIFTVEVPLADPAGPQEPAF
jgi:two-component system, sensor histidine kinase